MIKYILLVEHRSTEKCEPGKTGFVCDWDNLFQSLYLWHEITSFGKKQYFIAIRFKDLKTTRDVSMAKTITINDEGRTYRQDEEAMKRAIIKKSKLPEYLKGDNSTLLLDDPEHGKTTICELSFYEESHMTQSEFNNSYPLPRKGICKGVKELVYSKCEGHCAYCGKPITFKEMQVDHVVSHIDGGNDELANYLPACSLCNRQKSGGTLDEFRKYVEVDAPRIHFKKGRHYKNADADKIVQAYELKEKDNKVKFYFEKNEVK